MIDRNARSFRNGGASLRRRLTQQQRRALGMLASDPHGVTEVFLLAHWFTVTMLAGLVRAGLAPAQREVVKAGTKTTKVERYRITDAGGRSKVDQAQTVASVAQVGPSLSRPCRLISRTMRLKRLPAGFIAGYGFTTSGCRLGHEIKTDCAPGRC
jgi:hypothetical protein